MASTSKQYSCLMLGYSGFSNTGSEARVVTIIDDIRSALGKDVSITIATPAPEKTARILPEGSHVKLARFPFVFPLAVFRMVLRHDIVFLVEGSTFQQNWSCALLYFFLWGAWCASILGKKCVAYAVDAGELSPVNRRLTRHVCNRMDLLITRTERARERLRSIGVTKPIHANTDTAFTFVPDTTTEMAASASPRRTVGVAPIEFYQWPVRLRLTGPADECFHWPYYYTWTDERRRASRQMIGYYSTLVRHCIDQHGCDVVLIAMEELDTRICEDILSRMEPAHRNRIRLAYSKALPPDQMVPLLRHLDYLVTSRYHACVLSMKTAVPQMAVGHDDRLQSVYGELGISDFLLNYADANLGRKITVVFDRLVAQADKVKALLQEKHDTYYMPKCLQNRADLRTWAEEALQQRAIGASLGVREETGNA